jgi:hypothetical protein
MLAALMDVDVPGRERLGSLAERGVAPTARRPSGPAPGGEGCRAPSPSAPRRREAALRVPLLAVPFSAGPAQVTRSS